MLVSVPVQYVNTVPFFPEAVHSTEGLFTCFTTRCLFTCTTVEELRDHLTVLHTRYGARFKAAKYRICPQAPASKKYRYIYTDPVICAVGSDQIDTDLDSL